MNKDIRILLVDDHELARYGLRRMLEAEEDIEVVGDYANAEEALPQVWRKAREYGVADRVVSLTAMNIGLVGLPQRTTTSNRTGNVQRYR